MSAPITRRCSPLNPTWSRWPRRHGWSSAEVRLQRGEAPTVPVTLLKQALDQEPPSDLSARIGIRLADCLFASGDAAGGLHSSTASRP